MDSVDEAAGVRLPVSDLDRGDVFCFVSTQQKSPTHSTLQRQEEPENGVRSSASLHMSMSVADADEASGVRLPVSEWSGTRAFFFFQTRLQRLLTH